MPAAPKAPRFEIEDDTALKRDRHGIVIGGVRTPMVDVPVDVLSGVATNDRLICQILGSANALPDATLIELHGSRAAYEKAYAAAAHRAVEQGFVLAADEAELIAMAQPDRLPSRPSSRPAAVDHTSVTSCMVV